MTDEEILAIAAWLTQVIPILDQYKPAGFRDFRNGVPHDYRAGLFIKIGDAWHEPRKPGEPIRFKSKFGNCKTAVDAAASISALIGVSVAVECPHYETLECDGQDYPTYSMFWDISFKVSEERLRILAAAGRINVHDVDRGSLVSESGEAAQNDSVNRPKVRGGVALSDRSQ